MCIRCVLRKVIKVSYGQQIYVIYVICHSHMRFYWPKC